MNQSLWCIDPSNHGLYKDGTRDTNCVYGLSDIARHFIAGQLHHMDALTAIFAPDVNSYRRFCINSFAPTTVTWGFENRTAAVRVKVREDSALWENRVCAAPVNPYLAYAVSVAAGIDGINKKMDLQQPLNGSAYDTQLLPKLRPLPQSLEDAIRSLQKDQVICEALGAPLVQAFCSVKSLELSQIKRTKGSQTYYDFNKERELYLFSY
eukprot:GHVQ01011764.1.p1 GENE.GHVQ01011764.1~~GHVQ01011764.1.p1  ORF type:complete len:209 (+),score=26.96 GHVQ01011764.1:65-691(+)